MSRHRIAKTVPDIKHLTGADLDLARAFLRQRCYVAGEGFSSQYEGQEVSCTTTAICVYALSETSLLTKKRRTSSKRYCCGFAARAQRSKPVPFQEQRDKSPVRGPLAKRHSRSPVSERHGE